MDNLSGYAHRPLPFVLRYLRQRLASHLVIVTSVVAAVACSVGTQYGVKYLVDGLSAGPSRAGTVWLAFVFLMSLIAADNFLWRIASWTASFTFVGVTGDLRRDIFRHLTGHAPSYFSDRLPGMLTSRITATSNAVFTVENMFVWNVLPPCMATVTAIALIGTISPSMSVALSLIAGAMVVGLFHLAAAGKLRVEHRQASLEELGRLADPVMTKDAVAGRIRRLLSMADRKAKHDGIPDTESAVTPDLLDDA